MSVDFNSNMVRLKVSTLTTTTIWETLFQFQHGAIKSRLDLFRIWLFDLISIPTWCD